MVNLTMREDFYPEFPVITGTETRMRIKNVWESWYEDKYDDIIKGFKLDRDEQDNFCIPKLVKDVED